MLPAVVGQECPTHTFLLVSDHEIDCARLISVNLDWFLPSFRFGEDGALYAAFGENVIGLLLASETPALVPGDDLIGAGRDVGEFKAAALVGNRVVRMGDDHHFGIHPDVASVAANVDQTGGRHGA